MRLCDPGELTAVIENGKRRITQVSPFILISCELLNQAATGTNPAMQIDNGTVTFADDHGSCFVYVVGPCQTGPDGITYHEARWPD